MSLSGGPVLRMSMRSPRCSRAAAPTVLRRAAEVVGGAETWVVGFDDVRGVVALAGDRIVELSVDPPLRGQGIGMRRAGFTPAGDGALLRWHP